MIWIAPPPLELWPDGPVVAAVWLPDGHWWDFSVVELADELPGERRLKCYGTGRLWCKVDDVRWIAIIEVPPKVDV